MCSRIWSLCSRRWCLRSKICSANRQSEGLLKNNFRFSKEKLRLPEKSQRFPDENLPVPMEKVAKVGPWPGRSLAQEIQKPRSVPGPDPSLGPGPQPRSRLRSRPRCCAHLPLLFSIIFLLNFLSFGQPHDAPPMPGPKGCMVGKPPPLGFAAKIEFRQPP